MTYLRLLIMSLFLSAPMTQTYANSIHALSQTPSASNNIPLLIKKENSHNKNISFIEQALNKQKQQLNEPSNISHDDIKIMTTIHTQNFLAAQHQSFSRFIQNFFVPHES